MRWGKPLTSNPVSYQNLLPVEAYTSQEWFERELKELFGKCWQYVAMASDIPDEGDFLTVEIGAFPLVVIRGKEGKIHAFHNICRHRGTQLLRVAGKGTKVITCPYHDWTYSIEGELKSIPSKQRFPDIDMSKLGLYPALVDTWRGMIFVNPDNEAESLGSWLGKLDIEFGPHQPENLVEYEKAIVYEIKANWKIFVENYIDGYHLTHLHSETLKDYDHSKQESKFINRHWVFNEPLTTRYKKSLKKESPLPLIDHIPDDKMGAYVHMLFPCFGLAGVESLWSTVQIIPKAPDLTIVKIRTWTMPISTSDYIKMTKDDLIARFHIVKQKKSLLSAGKFLLYALTGDDGSDNLVKLPEDGDPLSSNDFMIEDIYACEQQQSAMKSPKFAIGPMTQDLEDSIVQFHKHVSEFMS